MFITTEINTNLHDFEKSIRMTVGCFNKLHDVLKEKLLVDQKMGSLRGGAIDTKIKLFITLRYLGGGSIHDL